MSEVSCCYQIILAELFPKILEFVLSMDLGPKCKMQNAETKHMNHDYCLLIH